MYMILILSVGLLGWGFFKCVITDWCVCQFVSVQYGFVNSALEKLIIRRFGVEKWDEVR